MVTVFDLDDTLYNEIDFVRSGFSAVAEYIGADSDLYRQWMWETFLREGSGKIFNRLLETFNISTSLETLIDVYRFHSPDISLSDDAVSLLDSACSLGRTALITDGNAQTQMGKFNVLNLQQWIEYPVFTALYHTSKPDRLPFEMIMTHFPEETRFVYIADNPKKDFFAPIELGWHTIRYNNPDGVYRAIPSNASLEAFSLSEIIVYLQTFAKEN